MEEIWEELAVLKLGDRTLVEITPTQKNRISHRRRALADLLHP